MIIDFHSHAFVDTIAPRAIQSCSDNGGGMIAYTDGTISGLKASIQAAGIDKTVLLPIATKPSQQRTINDWAMSVADSQVISFGSVHPDAPDVLDELDRLHAAGVPGVKFHPDYQEFYVNDPKMKPIYQHVGKLGMICVFHAGIDIGLYPPVCCPPDKLAEALPWFGGSPVVAAHLGGGFMWEDVIRHLCGKPLYFDTAYSLSHVPPRVARSIVKLHSPDKILFGTDSPWSNPAAELDFIRHITSSEEEFRKIAGKNAQHLLQLS